MRKLDFNEFKMCQILGRVFEKSVDLSNQSSPLFIRRFMTYEGAKPCWLIEDLEDRAGLKALVERTCAELPRKKPGKN